MPLSKESTAASIAIDHVIDHDRSRIGHDRSVELLASVVFSSG